MKNAALSSAGVIFLLVAGAHFYRYTKSIPITINNFSIPLDWSIYAGIVGIILTIWMFAAARK